MNVKGFVENACAQLSEEWGRAGQDGFLWMNVDDGRGKNIFVDMSKILQSIPSGVRPEQINLATSDAINIMTYERNVKEAVLCHNSLIPTASHDSIPIVSFVYHGSAGYRTNFRYVETFAGSEQTFMIAPRLGKWQYPADVNKWAKTAKHTDFACLVPYQRVPTSVMQVGSQWAVTVDGLCPVELYDGKKNEFATMAEAKRFASYVSNLISGDNLRDLNEKIYQMRVQRCPLQFAIEKTE